MTSVATRMSADASDTRNRCWGARSARLVCTAATTSALPTTVTRMTSATARMMSADTQSE
uniref:Uncharacterized protein n=1 Tax=Astyanax mexicanus TaxID=7994 RepID=A0A8B9KB20_ASTMX